MVSIADWPLLLW